MKNNLKFNSVLINVLGIVINIIAFTFLIYKTAHYKNSYVIISITSLIIPMFLANLAKILSTVLRANRQQILTFRKIFLLSNYLMVAGIISAFFDFTQNTSLVISINICVFSLFLIVSLATGLKIKYAKLIRILTIFIYTILVIYLFFLMSFYVVLLQIIASVSFILAFDYHMQLISKHTEKNEKITYVRLHEITKIIGIISLILAQYLFILQMFY